MNSLIVRLMLLALLFTGNNAFALDYLNNGNGYQVGTIRPGGDRPCTLFTLVGVSVVDASIAPGSPWFVIEHTAPEYNQMVATLLAAKATGKPIQVQTTGAVSSACLGHPTVTAILWI